MKSSFGMSGMKLRMEDWKESIMVKAWTKEERQIDEGWKYENEKEDEEQG